MNPAKAPMVMCEASAKLVKRRTANMAVRPIAGTARIVPAISPLRMSCRTSMCQRQKLRPGSPPPRAMAAEHHLSVPTRPFTTQRCMNPTAATGGGMASIAAANYVPFGERVARHVHLLNADDTGLHIIVCGDQDRPQILVPSAARPWVSAPGLRIAQHGGNTVAAGGHELFTLLRACASSIADDPRWRDVAERAVARNPSRRRGRAGRPMGLGEQFAPYTVGSCHQLHGGPRSAGVFHAVLILHPLGQRCPCLLEVGRDAKLKADLARDVGQERRQRSDFTAVTIDDQNTLEA